jgi:hypothetical protein
MTGTLIRKAWVKKWATPLITQQANGSNSEKEKKHETSFIIFWRSQIQSRKEKQGA